MDYQIDQSGKVEDTGRLTIVAFANGKIKTLKISAVEKRKLIKIIREADSPKKSFVFKIFAGLVFYLIKHEGCRAHEIAIEVFRGKRKADINVKAHDILKMFYK